MRAIEAGSLPRAAREDDVEFALAALRAAGEILEYLGEAATAKPLLKSDWTPVTIADFAVQAAVVGLLVAKFPADTLAAEEDSHILDSPKRKRELEVVVEAVRRIHPSVGTTDVLRWLDWRGREDAERLWTFDPIDGTRGLLRGGQYVSALALIVVGRVELGAMLCPRYEGHGDGGTASIGLRGDGAWIYGASDGWERMQMPAAVESRKPRMIRSVESGWRTTRRMARIRRDLDMEPTEIRMDSQVKYLALAAGEGDLVVRLPRRKGAVRENLWDHAAGVLLVQEAGGIVSDVHDAGLDFGAGVTLARNLGVVASVAGLHEQAIRAVEQALR